MVKRVVQIECECDRCGKKQVDTLIPSTKMHSMTGEIEAIPAGWYHIRYCLDVEVNVRCDVEIICPACAKSFKEWLKNTPAITEDTGAISSTLSPSQPR